MVYSATGETDNYGIKEIYMGKVDKEANQNQYTVDLHVPGLLSLLSKSLYGDLRVALRELIQNAHDSCIRRQAEMPDNAAYTPRIDIQTDTVQRQLTISDNGSGLIQQEIRDYFSTIGRSYTAELRERLEFGTKQAASELVGQFGLGLLSAFIVADEVELTTLSTVQGSTAWRWVSSGEQAYVLEESDRQMPGSSLRLHLTVEGEFLLNVDVLTATIREFADLLSVPIYINASEQPVNAMAAPWHVDANSIEDYRQYISDRYGIQNPLAIIPLHDDVERITLPDGTVDKVITPLSGVLFIPPASVVSLQEYGSVEVYINRMFITGYERELLPRWARFVTGVIDSTVLTPTLSREQVQNDDVFFRLRSIIERQLIEYFSHLARHDTVTWERIVLAHEKLIKTWALESPVFFDTICDIVTFDTSQGRMSLQEYADQSEGNIYYFKEARDAVQQKMLFDEQGITVINASGNSTEPFLKHYVQKNPDLNLVQLEPGSDFVFKPVDGAALEEWNAIVTYYRQQGILTRVAAFAPVSIPALMVYAQGEDVLGDAHAALKRGTAGQDAELIESYLDMRDPRGTGRRGVLHLNAHNELLLKLRALSPSNPALSAALELIYQNAQFFAGRVTRVDEIRAGFDMISYSLTQLVELATDADEADVE